MADHTEDNDPFEEDIVFDQAGLLGGKMPRSRQQATVGFLPTFMLFIRTVFLCIAFIGLGLCVSVSGSPLIRLEVGMGVPVDTAFHIFTARSIGMLLGGMLGSLLFDIYNRQFLMFVSLVWVAVSVTVLPFTVPTALWWTFTTTGALGIGLGFLFTGGNVLCLDLWGRQGGASLQSLHFSFAVGAFIAPLVIHPFFIGLHPAEIHNLTEAPNEYTTQVSEVARYVRNVREALDLGAVGNDSFDISSLDSEEIRDLTVPLQNSSFENSSSVNISSDMAVSLPNTNHSEPLTTVKSSMSQPDATPVLNATQKPAKIKKPVFTNGNRLEADDESRWRKFPLKENVDSDQILEQSKSSTTVHATNKSVDVLVSTSLPFISKAVNSEEVTEIYTTPIISSMKTEDLSNNQSSVITDKTVLPTSTPGVLEILPQSPTSDIPKAVSTTTTPMPTLPPIVVTTPTTTTTTTTAPTTTTTTTTTTTAATTTVTATTAVTTPKPPMTTTTSLPPSTAEPTSSIFDIQDEQYAADRNNFLSSENGDESHDNVNTGSKNTDGSHEIEKESFYGGLFVENSQMDVSDGLAEPELLEFKEPPTDELPSAKEGTTDSPESPGIHSLIHLFKPGTYSNGSDENNQFLDSMAQRFKDYGVTKVHLAYICIGIFIILNALISVVILCHNPREPRSKQEDGNTNDHHRGRMILFVVIFSVFMFMAEALQGAVHHLLASSSTNTGLDVIKESGLDGQALFWGLVCFVRFLCIMLSGCLRLEPGKLLTMAILFSIIGSIFLTIGSFGKEDFLWGGIIFMALGLAPILPTSLLWMSQYMRVTHRMCALMIILASFGNSLTHLALTHVIGRSHLYAYILVFISANSLCFLLLSMCVLYTAQRSKALGVPIGYQLASQIEEEDSIELTPSGSAVFTPSDPRIRENGEAGQSLLID